MAQFKIVKKVDFGPYTIQGPTGLQSDQVPVNNYAPKIGQVIEGDLETKTYYLYYDNKKHLKTGTGIFFKIRTNGAASTQAQSSDQFIPQDYVEAVVDPSQGGSEPNPNPADPSGQPDSNTTDQTEKSSCWICDNKYLIVVAVIIIILIIALKD